MTGRIVALTILVLAVFAGCQNGGNSTQDSERPNWPYRVATETSGATSYIFTGDEKPPITLAGTMVANFAQVNAALEYLDLPLVDHNVMEQESITGYRSDRGAYYWDNYSLGTLIMRRSTARVGGKARDVIWKFTLEKTDQ